MPGAPVQVLVRGVGAVTPLGPSWPSTVARLAEGASAVGPVTSFDVRGFPCTVAAQVPAQILARLDDANVDGPGADPAPDRRWRLLAPAADEAWRAAQAAGVQVDPARLGVFVGAESGRASFATVVALAQAAAGATGGSGFDHRAFAAAARELAPRLDASMVSPAAMASRLAGRFGARGPAVTVSLACASGAAAIAEAARAIRARCCDVALCGGVGADVDPLMLVGFGRLGALSARGLSCPFDLRRDGFVVGEGAGVVVLSAGGGGPVELAGEGRSLDAHHLTAPDPGGVGAEHAMRAALAAAGETAIDYVQAHGTSTPLNDAVEAAALRRVLGRALDDAAVSSVKGALGHAIAGAGALGFLCAYQAVAEGLLLPTANLVEPDPDCPLPHVRGRARRAAVRTALVNAFAFGGANAALVLRRAT
jgi:3-oxoacyl-[acyl-carrier-protein] synthase II